VARLPSLLILRRASPEVSELWLSIPSLCSDSSVRCFDEFNCHAPIVFAYVGRRVSLFRLGSHLLKLLQRASVSDADIRCLNKSPFLEFCMYLSPGAARMYQKREREREKGALPSLKVNLLLSARLKCYLEARCRDHDISHHFRFYSLRMLR